MPALVVLGARNLGRAVLHHFRADGWEGAAVARSAASLEGIDGLGLQADAADPDALRAVLAEARERLGGLDLIVNAVSASRPPQGGGPFGGGPLAEAGPDGFEDWSAMPVRGAFAFLSASARFLLAQGGDATVVQVTGGSSRRGMPGRGLWAAGAFGVRALTQAAAAELREHRIQVALLIVDATIDRSGGDDAGSSDPASLADAVAYLASQSPRAMTHELMVTPALDAWVP
jgi:NAD(P)-dependent dehydrogenase (short-subunit alcohol dehydrogenase family)